jgi:hypothetical protein
MAASSDKGVNKRIDKGTNLLNSVLSDAHQFSGWLEWNQKKPNHQIWLFGSPEYYNQIFGNIRLFGCQVTQITGYSGDPNNRITKLFDYLGGS